MSETVADFADRRAAILRELCEKWVRNHEREIYALLSKRAHKKAVTGKERT